MKNKLSSKLNINVVFRAEPVGGFTVLVPTLPGCITYGKDLKEAQKMAEEAITLANEHQKLFEIIMRSHQKNRRSG